MSAGDGNPIFGVAAGLGLIKPVCTNRRMDHHGEGEE